MKKSTHTPEYQLVLKKLVEMRHAAGLTQRELATLLKREYSFIWRIEKGERRLDLVEFRWVCQALNVSPEKIYRDLMQEMNNIINT